MTDVQIPLQQAHQKGMNGKFLPTAKNTLEIRGGSVATNTNTSSTANEMNKNRASPTSSSTSNSNNQNKKSLKLIDKNQASLTNFQLYPIRLNSNNDKLDPSTIGALVSVNYIYDMKSNNSSSSKLQLNDNGHINIYNSSVHNKNHNLNSNNGNINSNSNSLNYIVNRNNASNHWHDESNSGWTGTGVMSDRSSVYSIDDGDFDREASRKVNNQLREIESILYEQNSKTSSNLIECKEWLEKFPHIRILGSQIPNPNREDQNAGGSSSSSTDNLRSSIQSLSSSFRNMSSNFTGVGTSIGTTPVNLNNLNLESAINDSKNNAPNSKTLVRKRENSDLNNQSLYLNGKNMPVKMVSELELKEKTNEFSFLIEEIIEQDGTYEELLAYDNQEEEYIFEHNKRLNITKRRRHGLPPITPKASIKDLVTNILFDNMWSELIDWSTNTIKSYAKTISDEFSSDSTCKTPVPNNNKERSSSLTESSLNNDFNMIKNQNNVLVNSTNNLNILNNINNNISNNTNNNLSTIMSTSPATVKSANIIQLKPFDTNLNTYLNGGNNNNGYNSTFYSTINDNKSYTPGLLSRDNSSLNALAPAKSLNENMLEYKYSNYLTNTESVSTIGDLITGGIDDILKIKQINRNGVNSSISNTNTSKSLAPIAPQSRIGSGNRRQYQTSSNYRKRYSSIEISSNDNNKNIIIHGAALGKPSSLQDDHKSSSNNTSTANNNNTSAINTNNNSNSFLPLSSSSTGVSQQQHHHHLNNRSNNNSSQAFHHHHHPSISDENNYETDYHEYNFNNFSDNQENSIDEINLLNPNGNNNSNNKLYYYNHYNNHGYHYHNNHSNHSTQLPPIENSLTLKPMRISSANNLKQIKEKNERPMTSAATRLETSSSLNQKRSTTPSGLASTNRASALSNLYTNNMKITGIRLSVDDSIYTNNNFLSTKSFASLAGSSGNSTIGTTNNRRNSRESQGPIRIHK